MASHFIRTSHPGAVLMVIGFAIAVLLWGLDVYLGGSGLLAVAKWTPFIIVLIGVYIRLTHKNKWDLVYACPGCAWRGPLKGLLPVPGERDAYACPQCGAVAGRQQPADDVEVKTVGGESGGGPGARGDES